MACFLRREKLIAQHVLVFSTGSLDVPDAHITKADRIRRAVGMKVGSRGTRRLGVSARDWSRGAGCENQCAEQDCGISHSPPCSPVRPLGVTPWGTKDFYIEDPDGYIVSFGGTAAD